MAHMERSKSSGMNQSRLPNSATPVEYKHLSFLIFDAPSDANLEAYIKELVAHKVKDIVRACEPTYAKDMLENVNITVHDLAFADGDPPPEDIIRKWLALVNARMGLETAASQRSCIGVHCVAGLGRAPVLVAMALIEAGMAPLDAVIYIRERRRGAINAKQLRFIESYKRRGSKRDKSCQIQ